MSEDKAKKKLKNFFDKNASLTKRWKSLTYYIAKSNPDELPKFFNENFYMIYGVFLDTFQSHEGNCKKGKHSNSELSDLILVLKNILVHLSELIRKKWQTRSIASVLEKILYKENKIPIRLEGVELTLMFLEAIQSLEPSQTDLFATAIDLQPFCIDRNSNCKLRYNAISAPDKTCILLPANSNANGIENSTKLFEFVLDYMTGVSPQLFVFWFDLLKKHYLADFYPEISVKMKILDDGSVGFLSHCPYPIQASLISRLDQWLKKEAFVVHLFSMEENIQLLLEIFRQSCRMPITYEATTTASISLFQQLFFGPKLIPEIERRAVEFRQFFFFQVVTVFSISPEDQRQKHQNLCAHVVKIFKQIFQMHELHPETKECLLQTLLNTTIEVCRNVNLLDSLPLMLDTVFLLWIQTKQSTPHLWKNLQDRISSVLHVKEPVRQTKTKLLQLTYLIIDIIYPPRKQKKKVREVEGSEKVKKDIPNSISPDTRASIPRIPVDQSLISLNWNVDDLLYVWKQVLHIFRNINQIKEPTVHAESFGVIRDVIDVLIQAEEVPFSHLMDPNSHPTLCLIDIFGPWLFEALTLPESFIKGKEIAAESLCKVIIRHNVETLSIELLSHFYAIIYQCFKDHPNSIVSWSIIINSSNIFNISPEGCNVLVPQYITEIKRVLRGQAPSEVKTKCILIIASLICYPNHLDSYCAPLDFTMRSGEYNFQNQLKKDISQMLIETANQDNSIDQKVLSIWGLCCLAFEELSFKPNDSLVKEIVRVILPLSTHNDALVTRAALDALSTLALLFEELKKLDEAILFLIIDVLCSNVLRLLGDAKVKGVLREQLIADHYYCLNDWLMTCSTIIFDKRALVCKLFESIEIGLLGQKLTVNDPRTQMPNSSKQKNRMSAVNPMFELLDTLRNKPLHGSELVKESAQILLIQLCNFLQNFPSKEGVEIISSRVTEEDDIYENARPLFYIYNDFALFSLTEVPLNENTFMARLILRDCTGKYAWDSVINYNNNNNSDQNPRPFSLLSKPITPPSPITPLPVSCSDRAIGHPPRNPNADGPPVDQLDDLLQFLGERHKDCLLESGAQLNEPAKVTNEYVEYINQVQQSIITQHNADSEAINLITKYQKPYESWACYPPDPPEPISPLHHCRLFLSHLGFLAFEKQHHFCMVEDSQRFQRSLIQLDKTSGREMLKIGLIYVKYGQDDQKIILQNDSKSDLFAEFVSGLGWTIDIPSHKGYLGGLDPKLTTGSTAPYYANSIMEVVFHDITAMPTHYSTSDDQQIHKKRHVGNDIVHVVYSEHCCDYNPSTITSQFNDAHIIVYPLPNGLFRIQVYRKENVQLFGPLLHGMCVNKRILPALVRQTAINANRYVRYNTEGYCRPFPTRRKAIDEIVERFKVPRPYEDFIGELMIAQ